MGMDVPQVVLNRLDTRVQEFHLFVKLSVEMELLLAARPVMMEIVLLEMDALLLAWLK